MNKFQCKVLTLIMTVLLLMSCLFVGRETAVYVMGRAVKEPEYCVVLDAGHGGMGNGPKKESVTIPCI